MLTLVGEPGIGKTRLALAHVAPNADRWPDGVWFVDLSDVGLDELGPQQGHHLSARAR